MKRIAILASGEGRASVSLATLFNEGNRIKVVLAVSDRENAGILSAMQSLGVETIYVPRENWSDNPSAIVDLLHANDIDMLVLDGFGPLLPSDVFEAYKGKAVAVFPSLTPADSAGVVDPLNVQKEVVAARENVAGAVVCNVEDTDGTGTIILQQHCDAGDDPEALVQRVVEIERDILPRAVVSFINSDVRPSRNADARQALPETTVEVATEVTDEIPVEVVESGKEQSLEGKWVDALGIEYNPEEVRVVPPPVPSQTAALSPENTPDSPRNTYPSSQKIDSQDGEVPPMPSSYLVWSVLCTILCCFIPGIVAIIYSSQVSSRYYSHDYEGAKRSSEKAEIWIIVSFVLGIVVSTIYLPLAFL